MSKDEVDRYAADELVLFADNDGDIYQQSTTPTRKNLMKKRARGEYKHHQAVKAWAHVVEAAAKKYAKEHGDGSPWFRMFSPATREVAAQDMADRFKHAANLGEYDYLLPERDRASGRVNTATERPIAEVDAEIRQIIGAVPSAPGGSKRGSRRAPASRRS